MNALKKWRRAAARWLLATGLAAGPGCMSFLHPVDRPPPEQALPCQELPRYARDHVYVFLVNGMDPVNYSNLTGVRDYLHDLGFQKTYYGQLWHGSHYASEIQRIHQDDPEARFVLIGFSFGANVVLSLTNEAKKNDIPIDLLVYFGGNTLDNDARCQPENARHIINILAEGWIWHGAWMDRAENYQVPDVWHFGSPSHPWSLSVLSRELAVVAAGVPVPEREFNVHLPLPAELAPGPGTTEAAKPATPAPLTGELAPPPRKLAAAPPTADEDKWNFLEPQPRYGKAIQPTKKNNP